MIQSIACGYWQPILLLLVWLFGSACSDKSKFKSHVAEEATAPALPMPQPPPAADSGDSGKEKPLTLQDTFKVSLKVDIVFAVDTSPTMDGEIEATKMNLGRLIAALNAGKLDHRIHLLMDSVFPLPAGADPRKIAFVAQRVYSNDAISRLNALFDGLFVASYVNDQNMPLAAPIPFRADAKPEIVVITDDNGQGMGNLATDFNTKSLLKNYSFNSIVGLPNSTVNDNCRLASVGTEYMALSQKTGGSVLDLCSTDWSKLITRLSDDIVKRSVSFVLSQTARSVQDIKPTLDGKLLAPNEFSYDAASKTLTLTAVNLIKDGSNLTVSYVVK
ncbi:MAG TPA: hypothetical protein VFO10_23580 [Oligoflexus sp.]|uniref:hypothetical protein n=1 Tax=Oligoflexus sp. TaxID=1971216 RepID=UPI002D807632|nr:hypothetical protein [Oligoflexus sp.]HET9240264.1 hypothetical protein [Oligoflexus sp.]